MRGLEGEVLEGRGWWLEGVRDGCAEGWMNRGVEGRRKEGWKIEGRVERELQSSKFERLGTWERVGVADRAGGAVGVREERESGSKEGPC